MPPRVKNMKKRIWVNFSIICAEKKKRTMIICIGAVERRPWRACSPDPILAPARPRRWAVSGWKSSGSGWCSVRFFQSSRSWPFGMWEPTVTIILYRPGNSPLVDQATSPRRPLLEGTESFRNVVGRTKVVEHRPTQNRVSG